MKKKGFKRFVSGCILLGIMTLAVTASAEDNGYWTMKTDEAGLPVMIYTYTEPVVWVVDEQAGLGQCQSDEPQTISAVEQAAVHMANSPVEGEQAAGAVIAPSSSNATGFTNAVFIGICAIGLLSLAGMGYVLYKAV